MITVHNLTTLDSQTPAAPILSDVTCTIPSHAITLVVGRTGVGKSSFLAALAGLAELADGNIDYNAEPLWRSRHPGRINAKVLRQIGIVFQSPEKQLFAASVAKEVGYALHPFKLGREDAHKRIVDALRQVGLGLVCLDESPLMLSGGQKRRVAVASTIVADPDWLLMDEPIAALDRAGRTNLHSIIEAWRCRSDGGVVIATHDFDEFFELADHVIVLDGGRVVFEGTPNECCENGVLEDLHIGLPSSAQLSSLMSSHGWSLPKAPVGALVMAEMIADGLENNRTSASTNIGSNGHGAALSGASAHDADTPVISADIGASLPKAHEEWNAGAPSKCADQPVRRVQLGAPSQRQTSWLEALDPRAKWLSFVLLSAAIFWQGPDFGLVAATLLASIILWASHAPLRPLVQFMKPMVWLMGLSSLLAGLRFTSGSHTVWPHVFVLWGIGFEVGPAIVSLAQVYKIVLIMALGMLLPVTTTPLEMQRGLEQGLSRLRRLHLPVAELALATSLILRFIPVLTRELQRFAQIARCRCKSTAKIGRIRVRDLRLLLVPFVVSVIQLAEDLSTALEARGYIKASMPRTHSFNLQFRAMDYWLTVAAAASSGALIALAVALHG